MRQLSLVLASLSFVTLIGCEPVDTGGGGGVGGRVAFVRASRLLVSSDDGLGTGESFLTDAAGSAAEPAFSSNGQNLAFAFSSTGDADSRGIYLVPTAGGDPVPLAQPSGPDETFSAPTFTRDDSAVVFVRENRTNGERTLAKVSTSASGTVEPVAAGVTDVNFPAFIDDDTLLVLKGISSLQTLDLTSGTLTDLGVSTSSRGAVDRAGARVAYSKNNVITVLDLATKAETPLPPTGGGDVKPAFSPQDGAFVAFESAGKLYQVRADGTGSIEPLQSGIDVAWGL